MYSEFIGAHFVLVGCRWFHSSKEKGGGKMKIARSEWNGGMKDVFDRVSPVNIIW